MLKKIFVMPIRRKIRSTIQRLLRTIIARGLAIQVWLGLIDAYLVDEMHKHGRTET